MLLVTMRLAFSGHATPLCRFMPTSRRIVQFSSGRAAGPDAKIVYIDGAFDLFHVGHVEILKVRGTKTKTAYVSLGHLTGAHRVSWEPCLLGSATG